MNTNPDSICGAQEFGPLRIAWAIEANAALCPVLVYLNDEIIVNAVMGDTRPILDFSIRTIDTPEQCVTGALSFDTGTLCLQSLSYPGGSYKDVVLATASPPPPPLPPAPPLPPDVESDAEIADIGEAGDLFPYLYLRAWPRIPPQALQDRFVTYTAVCVEDDPRLYCQLAAIAPTRADARAAMIEQALLFVQGDPPYAGQVARSPVALGPGFSALPEFAMAAARIESPTPEALIALIESRWGAPWPAIVETLASKTFVAGLDRAWQNVFALNCLLGYDHDALAGMIRTLQSATLLTRIAATDPASLHPEWPPERLREGLRATLILPTPVFPLPSAPAAASTAVEDAQAPTAILPYAIGDLHMVRRRLLGYTLGEVSHIESVMAGEKKRRATAERIDDEHLFAGTADRADRLDDTRGGESDSFEAQVRNALREQFQIDYTTNYGPPQEAQQTGSVKLQPVEGAPTADAASDRVELARRITQQAARRVSTRLVEQRARRHAHSRSSETSQCFDRRGRDGNQRGIYRWLDARYRCWVVRVGRRLMLQYFVPDPARRLVAMQAELNGVDLSPPMPPVRLGLRSFEDISLDPASAVYYAGLAARYEVDSIAPPPPERAGVSTVFESGAPLSAQSIMLPEGYSAVAAMVALATADANLVVQGRIGSSAFAVSGEGDRGAQTITLAEQTDALPVSIALKRSTMAGFATGSADDPAPTAAAYALNIEVQLLRTPQSLAGWKSALYAQVLDGYRRQQARWLQASGTIGTGVNPSYSQRAIRGELIRAGLRGFLRLAPQRTDEVSRETRFAPALRLWLDQALEWSEMTFTLIDDPFSETLPLHRGAAHAADPFVRFLQADMARVLLPVAPVHERAVLYFMASGMVWNGEDALAPTFETPLEPQAGQSSSTRYVDLANDLKSIAPASAPSGIDARWIVTLPTAMSVLQDDDRLPQFPETE